jgi:hypothetical protein
MFRLRLFSKKTEKGVIDVSKINQGTEFVAEVTVKPKNERVENVALSQICLWFREIVNTCLQIMGMQPIT